MKKLPTILMLVARIAIGAYLVYLAYDMFGDLSGDGNLKYAFMAIAVVFAVFGVGAVVLGIKDMATGNYAGGAKDTQEDENVAKEEEI